eukprot:m.12357 g.12357  ORF g.12357 m.12357 type:complete len:112 (+) comp7176_c0_seq2:285-620(+)
MLPKKLQRRKMLSLATYVRHHFNILCDTIPCCNTFNLTLKFFKPKSLTANVLFFHLLQKVTQATSDAGDTTVKEINVCPHVDYSKAQELGLPMDVDVKEIIRDYVNTYIKK